MEVVKQNNKSIAVLPKEFNIYGVNNILDIMASAQYHFDCIGLVVYQENLGEDFFNLKTKYAGEILQKFSNYNMKLAIVGDFSQYKSKSLRDFITESNRGNRVFFKGSLEEAVQSISI